ncbi:hypothetical protein [Streptomyces sp. AM 2-1-1]|uniref:hypothetical protein n=1 Tax=Streptomyces sp. AM 2-1-1 TaxID=3028709 RepID=UPI0023BA3C8A|nr:hypothetical protein [Streptomyces sp. AM 2-1-1]WEH40585.1 hypothetical protein PZB77_14310 [Streptomyces sp. AM 2-1-1]
MNFRFLSDSGSELTAEPVILHATSDHPEPAVAVRITSGGKSRMLYVSLDRVEELLTGVKDTARQAAADFDRHSGKDIQ